MRRKKMVTNRMSRMAVSGSLALCLLFGCFLSGCGGLRKITQTGEENNAPSGNGVAVETTAPQETKPAELSVTDLMKAVMTVKDDLEAVMDDVKEVGVDAGRARLQSASQKTETIRTSLDMTLDNMGDSLPALRSQLQNIQELLDLVDLVTGKVLDPFLDQMQKHPISDMRVGEGVSTSLLCDYLDFAETLMPDVELLVEKAKGVDLSLVDDKGKIAGYITSANDLLEMYRKDNAVFQRLKNMLGAQEDRLYLIAAQNSAEIRASGGFPGAIGVMRIRDGLLYLEDFKRVYDVLSSYTPGEAGITTVENNLFHGGLSAPRDADFCPDFERVAYIWALGYETQQKEHVDGVISVTPAVLQKLLKAMDEEIKLFDGMVLNGDNAVKGLLHDHYYNYFGSTYVVGRNVVSDQLFADAAKKTSLKLMDNMELSDLTGYLSVAKECLKDRTLMLWMEDEQEQEILRKLGWNGGLNSDPQKPQAGIYYNLTVASKMGWFLIMEPEIGQRVKNEDGSYTYPITVKLSNNITKEEIREASSYITGGRNGSITGSTYFFAPAGGTVSDFTTNNKVSVEKNTYNGLELGYMRIYNISPDEQVVVTYNVTTAPGVEEMLTLSMTPTVQDYH